ncbi:MAG: twin-arginine translocation signal domain-containing protein, partial [Acidobacteriales bacterium]|nr:twin-arginine translocation signal domain-containing protein [Terriglobales bacterium]
MKHEETETLWNDVIGRRSFLKGLGAVGAVAPLVGVSTLLEPDPLYAGTGSLPAGDVAILRFLTAAEIIETDLWTQYAELGGVNGGNPAYIAALQNLDGDMPQYITDNTDDERSHETFLNAYLISKGAQPVNLDKYRTLPSTKATGAKQIGRLTTLQGLNVDPTYNTRYRSELNPDLGAMLKGPFTINNQPAIPISDEDTPPNQAQPNPPVTSKEKRMQAIANTAGFHFGLIEQGGSSLYPTLALNVTNQEVLKIVLGIGGVEIDHFSLWHDKAGNAVAQPLAGVTDPQTGVTFPDLNA